MENAADLPATPSPDRVRVWDLPTRVFHWALATAVLALLLTAWIGGAAMAWHMRLGYFVLSLLAFRLVWACIGGHWSRFRQLPLRPSDWRAFRAGQWIGLGHSPLGALSVLAVLLVLLLQVGTGLFSEDQVEFAGPLTALISEAQARRITGWHKSVGQYLILAWVALHLSAIGFYRWVKGRRLVSAMWSGDQRATRAGGPASADGPRQRVLALVLWLILLCAVLLGVRATGSPL